MSPRGAAVGGRFYTNTRTWREKPEPRKIHGLQFFFSSFFDFFFAPLNSFFSVFNFLFCAPLFMCISSSNTLPTMLRCRSETSVLYFRYVLRGYFFFWGFRGGKFLRDIDFGCANEKSARYLEFENNREIFFSAKLSHWSSRDISEYPASFLSLSARIINREFANIFLIFLSCPSPPHLISHLHFQSLRKKISSALDITSVENPRPFSSSGWRFLADFVGTHRTSQGRWGEEEEEAKNTFSEENPPASE